MIWIFHKIAAADFDYNYFGPDRDGMPKSAWWPHGKPNVNFFSSADIISNIKSILDCVEWSIALANAPNGGVPIHVAAPTLEISRAFDTYCKQKKFKRTDHLVIHGEPPKYTIEYHMRYFIPYLLHISPHSNLLNHKIANAVCASFRTPAEDVWGLVDMVSIAAYIDYDTHKRVLDNVLHVR